MKLMLLISSVREGRAADSVTPWIEKTLKQYPDIDLDIADLREINLPMFNFAGFPSMANGQYDDPVITAWAKRVGEADGFIFLTAEYNHGYTAAIKNALDWVAQGWYYKPIGFVSYGGIAGGARAVEQLRQVVLELRMFPLRDAVHIPYVHHAFDDKNEPTNPTLNDNLKTTIDELVKMQEKLVS